MIATLNELWISCGKLGALFIHRKNLSWFNRFNLLSTTKPQVIHSSREVIHRDHYESVHFSTATIIITCFIYLYKNIYLQRCGFVRSI